MLTILIAIASIAQVLVSLFVFSRDRRNLSNLLFFFIGIATLGWALSNYLTITMLDSPDLLYVVRLILFFVVIQNTFFYMFARTFPEMRWKHSKKWLAVYIVFSVLAAAATLSPFVFTSVSIEDGLAVTQAGPGIMIFIAHASFSIGFAFKSLIKKIRVSSGLQRNHLKLLLIASFLNWIVVPITNFAITPILKTTIFIELSPLYTLLFASLIAYAIVAQKLFDIKRAVARSVAYVLSLAFMGLIYGGAIFILSFFLTSDSNFDNYDRLLYISLALASAVLFAPTKKFFDRLTNRVFYRDSYDAQQFLDDLNSTIVQNIELGILLRHTTNVIQSNLKSSFCFIEIKATDANPRKTIGVGELAMPETANKQMREELMKVGKTTIIADELDAEFSKLKKILSSYGIAVLVRMMPGNDAYQKAPYYLILGEKRSGNVYDAQDIRIIEIIADELLIAIQNSIRFEEIQQFNVTLQEKVNDATLKLQKTNKKLRELDETKDEFISMASHQLRTPLTSVKGYMSMVLEGDAGKLTKQQETLLNQAFVSSQRMVYLIADLLNVSRLKTGKFLIDAQPTDLSEVVEGEIAQLTETAKSKKLKLEYKKPKHFSKLMLDETKIRQVIMNFADNAIYYTPSGGSVYIELKEDQSNVYFIVKDNGLGVPKEDQKHLFTKFYRAGNARKARPDGTGLGLFMAKKVVDAQGGTILFESREGKGSTFGFSFDKKKHSVESPKE